MMPQRGLFVIICLLFFLICFYNMTQGMLICNKPEGYKKAMVTSV